MARQDKRPALVSNGRRRGLPALASACLLFLGGASALDDLHFHREAHRLTGSGEVIHAAHHVHSRAAPNEARTAVRERSCPACEKGPHRCGAALFLGPRSPVAVWAPPRVCTLPEAAAPVFADPSSLLLEQRLYLLYPKHSPPSPR